MPGRHASDDRTRLRRDFFRLAVLLIVVIFVVTVSVVGVRALLNGGGDEPSADATPVTSSTSTSQAPVTEVTTGEGDTTLPPAPSTLPSVPTTLPPLRDPQQMTVLVFNSTSTAGLAGRFTEQVSDLGYQTLPPDNYTPTLDVSVIRFAPGLEREAEVLAVQIPDANLEPAFSDAEADLTVVLGESFVE